MANLTSEEIRSAAGDMVIALAAVASDRMRNDPWRERAEQVVERGLNGLLHTDEATRVQVMASAMVMMAGALCAWTDEVRSPEAGADRIRAFSAARLEQVRAGRAALVEDGEADG